MALFFSKLISLNLKSYLGFGWLWKMNTDKHAWQCLLFLQLAGQKVEWTKLLNKWSKKRLGVKMGITLNLWTTGPVVISCVPTVSPREVLYTRQWGVQGSECLQRTFTDKVFLLINKFTEPKLTECPTNFPVFPVPLLSFLSRLIDSKCYVRESRTHGWFSDYFLRRPHNKRMYFDPPKIKFLSDFSSHLSIFLTRSIGLDLKEVSP